MNNFIQTLVTQKNHQDLQCYYQKKFQNQEKQIQSFHLSILLTKNFQKNIKIKLNKLTGIFSSNGPIAVTTIERSKEKGKLNKELKAKHKLIKSINGNKTIYCSPGHLIGFINKDENKHLKKFLFKHQIKKQFQYSLKWQKNQVAIWDNRSMLHQATPFKGNRIMHRITIL